MNSVAILRELWRRRWLIAGVAVFAVLVGLLTTYHAGFPPKSRQYDVGVASASALVDTPSSQVVDLHTKSTIDAAALPARAGLLANLMANSPLKEQIAAAARIDLRTLFVSPPLEDGMVAPTQAPAASGSTVRASDRGAYVLQTRIPNLPSGQLPVIVVNTRAPTAAGAARLANGAVSVLQQHLQTVAGGESVPDGARIVLRPLGSAQSATEHRGPGPKFGALVATLTFAVLCGLILLGAWIARGWRDAAAAEHEAEAMERSPAEHHATVPDEDALADVTFLGEHAGAEHEPSSLDLRRSAT